jgi:drug/metabolite transporter (DMT)-like permease
VTSTNDTAAVSHSHAAPSPMSALLGVGLAAASVFLFALMNATTKTLAQVYAVPLIMAVRYIVQTLLMAGYMLPTRGRAGFAISNQWLVRLRTCCLILSSLLLGLGVQRVPVAEAAAIGFLAPMVVVLLSRPFLNEKVGALGWVAVLLGFAGVLLIVRPGANLDPLGVLFLGLNVLAAAFYQLLSRQLTKTESVLAMLFQTALYGAIAFSVLALFTLSAHVPTPWEAFLMVSLGVTGGVGHFLLTAAYRHAPASLLSPVLYLELVWAGLLSWLVFAHVPDLLSIGGMVIVSAAGILAALRSALRFGDGRAAPTVVE